MGHHTKNATWPICYKYQPLRARLFPYVNKVNKVCTDVHLILLQYVTNAHSDVIITVHLWQSVSGISINGIISVPFGTCGSYPPLL